MSEHDEQAALFQWARLKQNYYPQLEHMFAIPNGGHRHPLVAMKLKAEGVKSGVPDIFLPVPYKGSQWPNLKSFHGLFMELKAKKGKVSPAQQNYINYLNSADYLAVVCFGWESAKKLLIAYLENKTIPTDYLNLPNGEK